MTDAASRQATARYMLRMVRAGFHYRPERGPVDVWEIYKGYDEFEGDCEDFALALAWRLAGRSHKQFWLDLILMRTVFWFVWTSAGRPHVVLWRRGIGWTDNIYPNWRRSTPHRRVFPYPFFLVALKLAFAPAARRINAHVASR